MDHNTAEALPQLQLLLVNLTFQVGCAAAMAPLDLILPGHWQLSDYGGVFSHIFGTSIFVVKIAKGVYPKGLVTGLYPNGPAVP